MAKKFAIILSGCGQHDGSETHETILTLLAMEKENITWEAFAPDIKAPKVINHLTNEVSVNETRNVLEESARLVRGKIKPISQANVASFDAIVFPGGMGAVCVLSDWFAKNEDFTLEPQIKQFLDDAVKLHKPMGFICIAPMIITKIYKKAKFTIGTDKTIANQIKNMGCLHIDCAADDIVVDKEHKLVTTPANMLAKNINEVYIGIKKLIKELLVLCG